ncbi:folliculin-interacting protein 2 isoform X1 [Colias croceus]|uniref:folliculin-interacting protein 2 isoform X1 n=2 Tax=Colias crocea TaxID=72248 RepID=UPI001E27B06B|nr:folliculin-interacting protein 2 isoform X1 [Colias croceus]
MALLEKIFVTNGKLSYGFRNSLLGSRSREAELEQVRLLLYKECDRRGRRVLFDSSTIEKLPANKNDVPDYGETRKLPCIVEVVDGFKYLYKGPASDAGMLGEMIFGAVAMNCKSVSFKIHIMDDPKRLMCTKMFFVPNSRRISRADRKTDINANVTSELRSCSTPLNMPLREEGVSLSFSIDRGDSGFYGDHSYSTIGSNVDFFSMLDTWDGNMQSEYSFTSSPGRKLSSSGSWQRRTFQSMATRFDLTSTSLRVPTVTTVSSNDSQMYSNSVTSGTSDSLASSSVMSRRTKLGLALLITVAESADMEVIRRCVQHSNQLQSLVCRLRLATLRAGAERKFVSTLHAATEDAVRWLSDLMFGARLQPVWLNLVTSEQRQRNKIADTLLSDLCSVISVGDTKSTNFFISTLLTHVLTYHLGWVTTVSPYDTVDPTKLPAKRDFQRTYNALWAQLGDLCGSIGFPPRTARTIVAGSTNRQFITRLLSVLTYFMRCGDVKRNDFVYQDFDHSQSRVMCVKRTEKSFMESLEVCSVQNVSGSDSTLCNKDNLTITCNDTVSSDNQKSLLSAVEVGLKKSTTVTNLSQKLSKPEYALDSSSRLSNASKGNQMRRNPSIMISFKDSSDSSEKSSVSDQSDVDNKVLFVLGDNEKLIGLKNKSGGKSVKKSSKVPTEPVNSEPPTTGTEEKKEDCTENCNRNQPNGISSAKCCNQTLQHSKPIKHSGFKFEFDKYPQIVTNYMKSKNLEILDRHYIGKPGNLKLDNFQFDPTVVPQIQEETCETCYKCQMMESLLQTPTNASEMEYMNDMPRQAEPQYAKETIVHEPEKHRELSPKTFVRKRKENTVIINAKKNERKEKDVVEVSKRETVDVKEVIEFPLTGISFKTALQVRSGFDVSLLGGVTDHYVPDLILQGTLASPKVWEADLKRDLDLTLYLNKTLDSPMQAVAIIGDTNTWEVRVVGRGVGCGGLSPLVGGMLDALPAMRRACVPPHQCLLFLESKLREFCVLSKTLADMLMSTDFCDITTLTKSLNIDVNDVPLLLAVATTHTPQVAARYGISYR